MARREVWMGVAVAVGLSVSAPAEGARGIKARIDEAKQQLMPGFATGSRVHAYQSYAFVYNFASANVVTHARAVSRIQADGLPLLVALHKAGASAELAVHTDPHDDGTSWYGLDLVVKAKGKTVRVPGGNPTDAAEWHGAAAQVAKLTGVSQAEVEAGHAAWFDMVRVLNGLDTEAATLVKHAFAIEVLRGQVVAGTGQDWFGPRPVEETVADTRAAQALIADDVDRVRGAQAAVLATIALANHLHTDGVTEALTEELALTAEELAAWQASHRQPTPEDFGVVYDLPSVEDVQAVIDEQLGVVKAAADVVAGAATGNLPRTLDGIAGLAPKDTKAKAIAEGVAAASKGDITGTLGALADLGGPDTKVGRIAGRLETVSKGLDLVR